MKFSIPYLENDHKTTMNNYLRAMGDAKQFLAHEPCLHFCHLFEGRFGNSESFLLDRAPRA